MWEGRYFPALVTRRSGVREHAPAGLARTAIAAGRRRPRSVDVLGVPLGLTDYEQHAGLDRRAPSRAGERGYVCVCNVHAVMASAEDPELRARAAGLLDQRPRRPAAGVGAEPARPSARRPRLRPELMARSCARAAQTGQRLYLYGGRNQGALVQLALNLRQRYPGVKIVGGYSPPHRPLTDDERARRDQGDQRLAAPTSSWVGIGVPKQEKWMARDARRARRARARRRRRGV